VSRVSSISSDIEKYTTPEKLPCIFTRAGLYDIESSNNFDKNIIANVKLKEQLLVSYSRIQSRLEFFFKLFVEKYTLRWSIWYFRKKIAIQVARQTIKFFKKKMLGLYQNMEMRHRLAPNFASSFS